MSYIGELYMGTGTPQKVRVNFDTGSANPWILSKEGAKLLDPDFKNNTYDKSVSPTFQEPALKDQHHVTISFGSGEINGYFVTD